MANRYKLLVVDIDGTLLDVKGVISDIDKRALKEAEAGGTMIALSTGRVVQAARRFLDQLELDGFHVFFDGALVFNPETGKEAYVDPLTPQIVGEMMEYSKTIDLAFDLYSINRFFAEKPSWATDIRRDFFKLDATFVDFRSIQYSERLIKGTLVVSSPDEIDKARRFCAHFDEKLNFTWTTTPAYPDVFFINVITKGVSKGKALRSLTSFLGISTDDVAAIGDGMNDISLLSAAGLAIAMGDAPEAVKSVADHITLDVAHQGVSEAIRNYILR